MLWLDRMDALVWINGKITPPDQAKVSVFDRGFLFGDGVYETGRSYDRCLLFLEEHFARLRQSARKLVIPVPWSDAQLRAGLEETARAMGNPDVYFRTIITRGPISRVGLEIESTEPPTLVHLFQTLSPKIDEQRHTGVKVLTSKILRNPAAAQDPNIKTSNYLNSLLALQDARERGAEDAILCNAEGQVTEGTTFSVFAVTDDRRLLTPSLKIGILESITRRHVIEIARDTLKVEEGFFPVETLRHQPEVFITSSVREIIPVKSWDDQTYRVPGPITQQLHERLRALIQRYVASHAKF
jgi:branched-chain amino acid aminotransferase